MKKAFASIAVMTCVLCLAGCGLGSEPEHKITDPLPDKVIVEEEKVEDVIKDDKTAEESTEKLDSEKTEEELQAEYEEWKKDVQEQAEEAKKEQLEGETSTENKTDSTTTDATTEQQTYDPYSGLAVAKCHSVVLPKGVDYNTAIAEITKGTSAYPNTFPVIDNVDLNTPGVYTCAWVRLMDDGTYLPLNYAVFTVTIVDEYTGAALIDAEYCKWSMSNHSKEIIDYAKQYVHYYGNGEISGALVKEITVPGEYTIRWTSTDGAKFDQTVLVTE